LAASIAAYLAWDPMTQPEPDGWLRCTGPRGSLRRKFGEPALEYPDGEEPRWMRLLELAPYLIRLEAR
jgi:hypothetical protein